MDRQKRRKLENLLRKKMRYCIRCGAKRNEVKFNNLPKNMQDDCKEEGVMGQFVYCSSCNEYSILFDPEFGYFV